MKWSKRAFALVGAVVLGGPLWAGSLTPVPIPSNSVPLRRPKTWPMFEMQSHLIANLEKHHQITAAAAAALQADLSAMEVKFPVGRLSPADRKALHAALMETMSGIRAAVHQSR